MLRHVIGAYIIIVKKGFHMFTRVKFPNLIMYNKIRVNERKTAEKQPVTSKRELFLTYAGCRPSHVLLKMGFTCNFKGQYFASVAYSLHLRMFFFIHCLILLTGVTTF